MTSMPGASAHPARTDTGCPVGTYWFSRFAKKYRANSMPDCASNGYYVQMTYERVWVGPGGMDVDKTRTCVLSWVHDELRR